MLLNQLDFDDTESLIDYPPGSEYELYRPYNVGINVASIITKDCCNSGVDQGARI